MPRINYKSKNISLCTLTGAKCITPVVTSLLKNIPISIRSKLTPKLFFKVLTSLSIQRLSIHSIQSIGSKIPCESSLHHHLRKIDLELLKEVNHLMFAEQIKPLIKPGKKYEFAIDFTDDPYYGDKNGYYVVGGKRKASTNYFFSYATCYLIDGKRKFTIAVLPNGPDLSLVDSVITFVKIIDELGVKVKVLCIDREFYTHEVMSYLQSMDIPFIIPIKVQGNKMKEALKVRSSCCFDYIMNPTSKEPLHLNIVVCVKYLKGKKDKRGLEIHAFSVGSFTFEPKKVSKIYRRRFSIESSYRIRNISKPRTSSKKPQVRYLYTIISFLIQNCWVILQWTYFVKRKPGPKIIDEDKFRFDTFKLIVWNYFEKLFRIPNGVITISNIMYDGI
jgi:putative transposase